jgi:hypothetical protein
VNPGELRRELKRLCAFYGEVQALAFQNPLAFVEHWGGARSTLAAIQREVGQIEKRLQKFERPARPPDPR